MKEDLNNVILNNWEGIRVRTDIDEKMEEIVLAIKYEDHGDDFLLIKTKEKTYEYGWWLNREKHFYPKYDELYNGKYDWTKLFIRRPELFHRFDYNCNFSIDINHEFGIFDGYQYNKGYYDDGPMLAQSKFDKIIRYMKSEVENRGIIYHAEYQKDKLMRYLEKEEILTEENIEKIESVKWNNRIDGADGIAGKMSYDSESIIGDWISFIYYKGKKINVKKVRMKRWHDNWGTSMFRLSLNQFE